MVYYRIECSRSKSEEPLREPNHWESVEFANRADAYRMRTINSDKVYFVSEISDTYIRIGLISDSPAVNKNDINNYIEFMQFKIDRFSCEEICYFEIENMLRQGENSELINDASVILDKADIRGLCSRFCDVIDIGENLIEAGLSSSQITERAKKYLVSQTFLPEYRRIKAGPKKHIKGHPCHYFLSVNNLTARKEISRTLLSALYDSGRLLVKRYSFIDIESDDEIYEYSFDQLFRSSRDSAIVIRFKSGTGNDGTHAVFDADTVNKVTEKILKYKNHVLCIVCVQPGDCALRDLVLTKLGGLNLVQITDDIIRVKEAASYFRVLARENGIKPDDNLFEKIEPEQTYNSEQLNTVFENWYADKIRLQYPQYSTVPVFENHAEKKKTGKAYDEIQKLIGLGNAKKMLDKVLNYYKGMNLFRSKGLVTDTPSRHIVLTGNPGTCKTTFARLLAGALRESSVISSGAFVEVGKGDLCAKYVGWTAKTVKEKFSAAEGGILFIDEAYALDEHGRGGSFAEEAINAIVQEMENHKEKVIVVFAGYPEPMEEFLKTNPGLRSRIAFHINMDDYSTDELLEIAELTAKNKGMRISAAAAEKMRELFDKAREDPEYGAGRFVRNVIEQAKMAHVSRLLESGKNFDDVTEDELITIEADDIDTSVIHTAVKESRKIGFVS